MLRPGEYADVLRALGQTLDSLTGRNIEINERETSLAVSWLNPRGETVQRVYDDRDVNALRSVARDIRAGPGAWSPGANAERLRTIGQSLDRQGIVLERIAQLAEGFRVTGMAGGHFMSQWYTLEVLRSTSEERRGERNAPFSREEPLPPRGPEHLTRRPTGNR